MKYIIILFVVIIVGAVALFSLRGESPKEENNVLQNNQEEEKISESIMDKDIVRATITTAKGDIVLNLYPKVAPKTVLNFVTLANDNYYDGTTFHRVIANFMIQGGDSCSKTGECVPGTGGPGYQFKDEINPKVLGLSDSAIASLEQRGYVYDYSLPSMPVNVGTIAMANAGPNTNGSQFFIVSTDNQSHLNGLHTVFGDVASGMDVVLRTEGNDVIISIVIE